MIKTLFKQKLVGLVLPFLLLYLAPNAWAQKPKEEDNACVLNLERANEMYREGKIDLISEQLLPCLNRNRLNKENTIRAYRLLIITQLYLNEKLAAADYMVELLKLDPEYEINENLDPTEFIQLYDQFRTRPVLLIGINAGGNYSFPTVINNYSLDNPDNSLGTYTPLLGYSIGMSTEVPVFKRWSVLLRFNYHYNQFQYFKKQFSYSELTYVEEQTTLDLPLQIRFYITKGKFRLFAQAGASYQHLLNATATLTRIDSLNEELGNQTVAGPTIDMTKHRIPFSLSLTGGLGFSWKGVIGNGNIMGSVNYTHGMDNLTVASERYSNAELLYDYNYIDNDFSMNSLRFMIGYALPIYKPKLMDRNKRKNRLKN